MVAAHVDGTSARRSGTAARRSGAAARRSRPGESRLGPLLGSIARRATLGVEVHRGSLGSRRRGNRRDIRVEERLQEPKNEVRNYLRIDGAVNCRSDPGQVAPEVGNQRSSPPRTGGIRDNFTKRETIFSVAPVLPCTMDVETLHSQWFRWIPNRRHLEGDLCQTSNSGRTAGAGWWTCWTGSSTRAWSSPAT